jgi:L-fuconolactonase
MRSVIDTHHHLWNYNREEYSWMDHSMKALRRDYLVEELENVCEQEGVSGTVAVQARQSLKETEWLLCIAEKNERIKGVVGWVDLRSSSLGDQLDALVAHPKFAGIRHVLQDEPDKKLMLTPSFMQGIAQLKPRNLTYDLLIHHDQLSYAAELAGNFPEQKFILDHLGKPPIRSGRIQPWQKHLEQLSRHPNVWCKISGLVTEADHRKWTYESLVPYMDVAVQAFGADRIMLGSDWPVCLLAAGYPEVMAVFNRYFASLGPGDRWKIYFQNAVDCYELEAD